MLAGQTAKLRLSPIQVDIQGDGTNKNLAKYAETLENVGLASSEGRLTGVLKGERIDTEFQLSHPGRPPNPSCSLVACLLQLPSA
jgi:hypothetical protein